MIRNWFRTCTMVCLNTVNVLSAQTGVLIVYYQPHDLLMDPARYQASATLVHERYVLTCAHVLDKSWDTLKNREHRRLYHSAPDKIFYHVKTHCVLDLISFHMPQNRLRR